ncbi:MAG: tetratricopeptide repeat protein, partial [Bradymonadaceae bacterium]
FEVVGELNRRIGRLLDRELDRPEEAIDYWERARDVDPEHLETLEALDRLYEDLEQWEELADVLRAREYATDDAETSIELRSRLGLLQQEALGHTHEAIDLYESILEDDPERELPVEQLEQMFTEGREPERIMAILEPHYAERGEIEQQVDLFRGRLEQVDDPDERFDLYRQIGQLQVTELDRPEAALEAFGEALVERPSSEEIVDRIEQLADETGSWERAAASFYDALETGEATDRTGVRLWKGLARILDEELDQTDDAEMAYRQALELEPGDEQALASLDDLYEQQQRWADLADILRRRIEEAYDEGKLVDLRLRLAKLLQHDLEALDEAVVVYRELLDTEPGHEEALSELEQIHRQREEWQDLYDVLQRRVDATMDPEIQAACYTEMARLAEERLDRPFDAVDLWNSVLDLEPDDRTALEALEDLYIDQERWEDLVEILDREVELADDPEERAELNRLLGTVWGEKLGNDGPALEAWREVLDVDPHDLEA